MRQLINILTKKKYHLSFIMTTTTFSIYYCYNHCRHHRHRHSGRTVDGNVPSIVTSITPSFYRPLPLSLPSALSSAQHWLVGMKTAYLDSADDIQELHDYALHKFVEVYLQSGGHGTGCIVEHSNYPFVVTNHHVVKDEWVVSLGFLDDTGADRYACGQVIYADHLQDMALISFDADNTGAEALPIAESGVDFGEPVMSLGFHRSYPVYNMGYGMVTCPSNTPQRGQSTFGEVYFVTANADTPVTQSTAAQYRGYSGGPLIDDSGQLVGINFMSLSSTLHYAMPANDIEKFIKTAFECSVRQYKRRIPEHSIRLGLCLKYDRQLMGCQVVAKFAETNANNKLNINDIVVEINGQKIQSLNDFKRELSNKLTGNSVDIPIMVVQQVSGGQQSQPQPVIIQIQQQSAGLSFV
ncbi:serine protease HTRA1-like [Oppia nitens]|uniref:serine protease HTRA1-like n=1 Tax=Oppia nitens TaxID=1686743 RepID=UPI0023DB16B8|nr:serine protease HTRA1-like [Oppia nitens]